MKALVSASYGPLEALEVTDLPAPRPEPGEVLLRTEAVSLNGVDPKLVTGAMKDFVPVRHPFVPGADVAGVVEAVGPDVTRFAAGDPVIAALGAPSGGLAELVVVKDDARLAVRPAGLDAVRGAALVTGAATALTVVDAADVGPGETVLVVGATGGVGSFTVQLARRTAGQVFATGRADDEAFLLGLGAHALIDREADLAAQIRRLVPAGVDVVLDVVQAGPALASSAAAARPGGRLVSVLGGPPAFDRGVGASYVSTQFPPGRLADLAAQAADGRLDVPVGATYPFADVRSAYLDFTTKHVAGKYVVTF
ncbi:NADP-dependent oxidoreductase [Jiangella alkaliphila]|uniref:NADPH:quinone reductase n=1 Tax=Jiangella alkaliphila TaxID=419479 RepID=A0A1H2HB87_9ACTN|nr:NADP-dependent oxidoreductase [Jiangella alkaliphila]SDU29151.1 NADPH:quinone reductase [Jiangella alkaliphila]